ncbi:MAG: phosphatase PAP2 family protein [Planctomycetota bacterium]
MTLDGIERAVIHAITCTWHHPVLGGVFRVLQSDAVAIPLFLLATSLVARRDGHRAARTVLTGAAAFGVGMLIATLLWATIPRERPPHAYERWLRSESELATCASHPEAFPVRDRVSTRRSFPSRHGITVGAFVTALVLASWRLGLLAIPYGLLVAVGRVYVGRHWPTDVLAGIVIGTTLSLVAWRLAPRFLTWPPPWPGRGAKPAQPS